MLKIDASLKEFTVALKKGEQVNVTRDGYWYVEGLFMRIIRWLFDLNGSRIRNVVQAVHTIFEEAQRNPLQLKGSFSYYKRIIKTAKIAKFALKEVHPYDYQKQKCLLKRKIVAMQYWVGERGGGFAKERHPNMENSKYLESLTKVTQLATSYKASLWQFHKEKLHPVDNKFLRETARYEHFVKLLEKDKNLQEEFFSFTIRYLNPPNVFIEHPEVVARLRNYHISPWIGRFAYQNPLKIVVDKEHNIKTVTLPFGGRDFSIIDPKAKVQFPGEKEIPLQVVFDDMKNKDTGPGEYNFFGKGGFQHWHLHKLAHYNPEIKDWDPIDLERENWWEQLPDFERNISKRDILNYYGIKDLPDNGYVILLGSAKQNKRTRFDDCHGFTEVVIPNGDGTYGRFPFGKYPTWYPKGTWAYLQFVTDTRPAGVVFPDYNQGYGAIRQYAGHVVVTDEASGKKYLEEIRRDIQRARKGHLYFQFGGENCSFTVQDWADEVFGKDKIPRLFLAHITTAGCVEPLDSLIGAFKDLPENMSEELISITARLLGSKREVNTVDKKGRPIKMSLYNSPFHQGCDVEVDGKKKRVRHYIHLPSQLHRNIEQKKFHGLIWSGFQRFQPQESWGATSS